LNFPAATTAKKSTALFAGQFDALVSPQQTCGSMPCRADNNHINKTIAIIISIR